MGPFHNAAAEKNGGSSLPATVDDFRFNKRMPSRAAAVRELLRRGLAAEGSAVAAVGAKSSAFGVTGKAPSYEPEVGPPCSGLSAAPSRPRPRRRLCQLGRDLSGH